MSLSRYAIASEHKRTIANDSRSIRHLQPTQDERHRHNHKTPPLRLWGPRCAERTPLVGQLTCGGLEKPTGTRRGGRYECPFLDMRSHPSISERLRTIPVPFVTFNRPRTRDIGTTIRHLLSASGDHVARSARPSWGN